MAKNDNLTDFLTDVASAIRAKKGTTDKINPQDFSSEIYALQESTTASLTDIVQKTITNVSADQLSGATIIGHGAFYDCSGLTNITIPNSVTSIGGYALQIGSETNKATITFLGETPPTIESDTFNASYLNKIIVPAGCGETYKAATNWSTFADYIEEATE